MITFFKKSLLKYFLDILKSEKCSRHGHSSTSLSFSAFHKNRRYLTCTKSHWSVIFFRTRLHVPTYKSAWIRTDILIQIKKEMSLKLSIQNIFFFNLADLAFYMSYIDIIRVFEILNLPAHELLLNGILKMRKSA